MFFADSFGEATSSIPKRKKKKSCVNFSEDISSDHEGTVVYSVLNNFQSNLGLLARANKIQKKLKRPPKLTEHSDDSILVKNYTSNGSF